MHYIALHFKRTGGTLDGQIAREILVAELGAVGFESFTETEDGGLSAYIQSDEWIEGMLEQVQILSSDEVEFKVERENIEQVNWNEEWEKNFEPIEVQGKVSVRAPFHSGKELEYNIVIEPKMSFGTGHHETTHLMIEHLLEVDLQGKKVLDMGCGTGILAIFSEMRGASEVDAIDIDPWCYENSVENAARNNCRKIKVFEGDAGLLKEQQFDVLIANINRNILLEDMSSYVRCLKPGGLLLLSGFYIEDMEQIGRKAQELGLKLLDEKERNRWVGLKYVNLEKA
jgi:ribosomal protein L11 methyltransferase